MANIRNRLFPKGFGGDGRTGPTRPGVNPLVPTINKTPTNGGFQIKSDTPILDKLFGNKGEGGGKPEGSNDVPMMSDTETGAFVPWRDTEEGKAAYDAYNIAANAVKGYGNYTFSRQSDLDDIMRQIEAHPEFTYDLDGDALYQQYKDQFMRQGALAMEDTVGKVAALTGGYGNSYAQTAGQQAFYQQLDQLNDVIPELYQLAYDKHKDERDALYDRYSLLAAERDDEYDKWADERDRLIEARDDAKSVYDEGESEYLDSLQPDEIKSYINNMSSEDFVTHLKNYADDPDALNDFLRMCEENKLISHEQSLLYYTMMVEKKDDQVSE